LTPTFSGRIQTRLFLLIFIGIPVTLLFGWLWAGFVWDAALVRALLTVLVTLNAIGFILDPFYIWIQRSRWDRDWPFAYQFFFSWVEFGLTLLAVFFGLVPFMPDPSDMTAAFYGMVVAHFASVFVPSFLFLLGPLQVLSLRWRYNAGQFGRP
jgi:hypothetical protein